MDGTSDEKFLAAVERSNAFLSGCAGFIERRVGKRGAIWLDVVLWESMETALAAAKEFNRSPETLEFNSLLKQGTVAMNHYELRAVEPAQGMTIAGE